MGFALGLNAKKVNQLTRIMLGLYKLLNEKDLALVELNPLAIIKYGEMAVLDGKINSDENATLRNHDLARLEERGGGKECVSMCRSRWWQDHEKKNTREK